MTAMAADIQSQPQALMRTLAALKSYASDIRQLFQTDNLTQTLIVGRGTSGHIGDYLHYLLATRNGIVSSRFAPSLAYLQNIDVDLDSAVVVAITQSGATAEILETVEWAARQGARTLAITNVPESPITARADMSLVTLAGIETAIPATKSYTTGLLASALLSGALGNEDLSCLGSVVRDVERAQGVIESQPMPSVGQQVICVGRGFGLASARETALKLQECARVPALAFSAADLLHGPVALLQDKPHVVLFLPDREDPMWESMDICRRRALDAGCPVTAVGPDRVDGATSIRVSAEVPWLSPLVHAVVGQTLALNAALQRGLDPDHPVGLNKVTTVETRP